MSTLCSCGFKSLSYHFGEIYWIELPRTKSCSLVLWSGLVRAGLIQWLIETTAINAPGTGMIATIHIIPMKFGCHVIRSDLSEWWSPWGHVGHRGGQQGWKDDQSFPKLVGLRDHDKQCQLNQCDHRTWPSDASKFWLPSQPLCQLYARWGEGSFGRLDREWHWSSMCWLGWSYSSCAIPSGLPALFMAYAEGHLGILYRREDLQWQWALVPLHLQGLQDWYRSDGPTTVRGWGPDQDRQCGHTEAIVRGGYVPRLESFSSGFLMWWSDLFSSSQWQCGRRRLRPFEVGVEGVFTLFWRCGWEWCRSHRI